MRPCFIKRIAKWSPSACTVFGLDLPDASRCRMVHPVDSSSQWYAIGIPADVRIEDDLILITVEPVLEVRNGHIQSNTYLRADNLSRTDAINILVSRTSPPLTPQSLSSFFLTENVSAPSLSLDNYLENVFTALKAVKAAEATGTKVSIRLLLAIHETLPKSDSVNRLRRHNLRIP